MLPRYFDYIFVNLRQKACLKPELSPKFYQLLAQNQPEKTGSIYSFDGLHTDSRSGMKTDK